MAKFKTPTSFTPDEIIREVLAWDKPANIRENLNELMLSFFLHHDLDFEQKNSVYASYQILMEALKQMEKVKMKNIPLHILDASVN